MKLKHGLVGEVGLFWELTLQYLTHIVYMYSMSEIAVSRPWLEFWPHCFASQDLNDHNTPSPLPQLSQQCF